MRYLAFLLTPTLVGCATIREPAQPYERETAFMERLSTAAILGDAATTYYGLRFEGLEEANPILGRDPSDGGFVAYNAVAITANLIVPRLLFGEDHRARFLWHSVVASFEVLLIYRNLALISR